MKKTKEKERRVETYPFPLLRFPQFDSWLGSEYPRPWDATLRDIVKPGEDDVAFLGFVRPGVGESSFFFLSLLLASSFALSLVLILFFCFISILVR